MALIPANAASAIMRGYRGVAAIGPDGRPTGQPPTGHFPTLFANAYHEYASAGEVPGALSGGGNPAQLSGFLAGRITVRGFAEALAGYWAGVAVEPGTPAHGGASVSEVVNDAAAKVGLFESAINASLTQMLSDPGFERFVANVQNIAVSSVVWTVTEVITGTGPVDFQETIT